MSEHKVKILTGKPGRPKGVKVLGGKEKSDRGFTVYNDEVRKTKIEDEEPQEDTNA